MRAGNLDLVYSAEGQLTNVVLGQAVAQNFDATAIQNQKDNLGSLPLADGAEITSIEVVVGPPTVAPGGSKCRSPSDTYFPVQTSLYIEMPIVACTSLFPGGERTQVGLLTFDTTLHFYNLSGSSPAMMVVPEIDETFVPMPDELLVNLAEKRNHHTMRFRPQTRKSLSKLDAGTLVMHWDSPWIIFCLRDHRACL